MDELSVKVSSITLNKPLQADIKVDKNNLARYVSVYKLSIDGSRTITILEENDQLIGKILKTTEKIPLVFQSDTKFQFKNITDANCEFVTENSKVTKFNVSQNGHYEWIKIR